MVLFRHRHESGSFHRILVLQPNTNEKRSYFMKIDAARRIFRKPILNAALMRLHGSAEAPPETATTLIAHNKGTAKLGRSSRKWRPSALGLKRFATHQLFRCGLILAFATAQNYAKPLTA
ncbi:MAG: hypothetical protein E5W81_16495 [Mesorhizobium sp.]|nr:MAG: hypothetical protein E5V36_05645 [Mesorhizobium sp.]TKB74391.1 MAG: hypothetical protein E5W81_16495 [Mesorhizobium sp.]